MTPRLRGLRSALALSSLFLFASTAFAFEGRLLLPDGAAAAGFEVSVVGRASAVLTDSSGGFTVAPDPAVPFELIAIGPGGQVSPPVRIESLPASGTLDVTLAATFRETITVATGVAAEIDAPPAAALLTIAQENLEQRRPERLVDALDGVAGVVKSDESLAGVPSLRGQARGRTLILLDGARVLAERRAGASATFLDPFTLGSIEVARGAGAVAYGSDAFGGVIHARPRDPQPGPFSLRFDLSQGFLASEESAGGLEISKGVGEGAFLASVHARRGRDGEDGDGNVIPVWQYDGQGAALRYAGSTSLGRLRVGLAYDEATDVGKPASDFDRNITNYPQETSRRFNLGLDTDPRGGWESFDLSMSISDYRLVLDRDRLATSTTTRIFETSDVSSYDAALRGVASRAALGGRIQLGLDLSSRFGLEAIARQQLHNAAGAPTTVVRARAIEDAERTDLGAFATWDRALGSKVSLSLGARGDSVKSSNTGGFFGDRSETDGAFSGQAALTFALFPDATLSLQAARGFRVPTLSDRYFKGPSGRGQVTGNPDLEPEKSLQFDTAFRWARGGRSVAVYAYRYDIENLIERIQTGRDFFFRNTGEARIEGAEIEAQVPLGGGFGLELLASWSRGENLDNDLPVDDVGAPNAGATLRWAGERAWAYFRAAAYTKDDRPGPSEQELAASERFDLGLGWRFTESLELRLIGRNLTDELYRESPDAVSAYARGRTVSVGLVGKI